MPVILALVLVLGGGGFFMMKGKGAPPKVEVKAGIVQDLEKEFLVNLAGGPNVYLRAEIALELREGYTKEALEEQMPAIRDCINQILRSKSLQQVGATSTQSLRTEIAKSINKILISHMKEEEKKKQEEFEKAVEDSEKKSDEGDKHEKEKKAEEKKDEEDWVCPAGPVLNVYFTAFTTQ